MPIGDQFSLECFVIICDEKMETESKNLFNQQMKMLKIVSHQNVSAAFGSLEKKSYCGYFLVVKEPRGYISEIYEKYPNTFENFHWFISVRDVKEDIGLTPKLNSKIKLLKFDEIKCEIFDVYGIKGDKIVTKTAILKKEITSDTFNFEQIKDIKLEKDLQGITLR